MNNKIFSAGLILSTLATNATNVLAAQPEGLVGSMKALGDSAKYTTEGVDGSSMAGFIGSIVAVFLGVLGVIFVILFIVAGYNWMMAGGDTAKLDKAKDGMWRAIIGLLIVISSYAIQSYVFSKF